MKLRAEVQRGWWQPFSSIVQLLEREQQMLPPLSLTPCLFAVSGFVQGLQITDWEMLVPSA